MQLIAFHYWWSTLNQNFRPSFLSQTCISFAIGNNKAYRISRARKRKFCEDQHCITPELSFESTEVEKRRDRRLHWLGPDKTGRQWFWGLRRAIKFSQEAQAFLIICSVIYPQSNEEKYGFLMISMAFLWETVFFLVSAQIEIARPLWRQWRTF